MTNTLIDWRQKDRGWYSAHRDGVEIGCAVHEDIGWCWYVKASRRSGLQAGAGPFKTLNALKQRVETT